MEEEAKIFEAIGEHPELPLDNVVPIPQREVYRINGIKLDLGKMSLVEMLLRTSAICGSWRRTPI